MFNPARREGMTAPLPASRRPRQHRGDRCTSARREGMMAPLPTSRRPRQHHGHLRDVVDWPVFAVWISGMVVVVAFWTAVGLGI